MSTTDFTAEEYLYAAPPFDREDCIAADWNCGPAAIAAVVRLTPAELESHLGTFRSKGYTNPTLMFAILRSLGIGWRTIDKGCWPSYGLVRIQWHGPWMNPGVPIAARYRKTHWVGCRSRLVPSPRRDVPQDEQVRTERQIFDVNCIGVGGWVPEAEWKDQVVPWLVPQFKELKGWDGRWSMTHCLSVEHGIRLGKPK